MTKVVDAAPARPNQPAGGLMGILARCAVLALVFMILGVPVTDVWRFLLLTVAVMALCFGGVRFEGRRWVVALASVVAVAALNWLLPSPHIEEGHNVYIPVGTSLDVFNTELPPDAQRKMQQIFDESYINDPKNLPGSPDWWKSPVFAQQPSCFVDHAFSTSSDALWQQPKYSRTADAIDFTSQEQARIGAINRIAYNFYRRSDKKNHQSASGFATDARIDRSSMPFFVMLELNGALAGGEICWRGQTLWEEPDGQFSLVDHADRACRAITEQDQGKRVFALAIAPDKPLSFTVYPNLPHRATLWAKIAARVLGVFTVLAALVRIETISQLLLPIGAVVSTLLTILIISPDFLLGFHTYVGGNDGLTHESLGFSISQALALGHFKEAFRGGENVFYFMPGLRYLKAIEDMLFGDTNFGMILCTGFIPIFLYFIISRLFPLRWSVCLILIFMFIPIFERFGFAQFLYVREMIKGFPEPVGYGAFLGALALIAWSVPMPNAALPRSPMPSGWIGLALALSVAMRPNLAVAAALLLVMVGAWLLLERRWKEFAVLGLGFSPILLIALHNLYFGGKFVPLTSAALISATFITPPSVYLSAFGQLLHLNFGGEGLALVRRHLNNWNHLADFYRLIALFAALWVMLARTYPLPLRGLAAAALSMQVVLLFYLPTGRYAYLAWLLVFLVFLVAFREGFLPWLSQSYPGSLRRLARLPGLRQMGGVLGSSRWSHAHQLSQVTPPMGFITGLKMVCRPLVSPLGQVLQLFPRGSRVFDVDCGSGGLLHLALNDAGVSHAAGYDVSSKAVGAAQTLPWRSERLHVVHRMPGEGVPDLSGADYVTLCDVLHHVPPEAKASFLKDITEKMRPGAVLVLVDIDASRRGGSWMNQLHDLIVSQEWVVPVAAHVARSMLQQAGMVIREESFVRSLWYPHYLILAEKPSVPSATPAKPLAPMSAAPG
jgi:2-polyprenyl-3-methyl-5-hydroxy-6-metoxy-1,4-benzoquinol methylase